MVVAKRFVRSMKGKTTYSFYLTGANKASCRDKQANHERSIDYGNQNYKT